MRKYLAGIAAFGMLAGTVLPAGASVGNRRIDAPMQIGRFGVAGVPRSMFPSRDFGRRLPQALVSATITLRYNRQYELDALVQAQSNPRSPLYRHFLTSAQFNNYFAPTPQQEAYVAATLQAAGLRVIQTFPNRTLLDVVGTSAAAERFFHTEMHSLSQGVYGERFANVTPATIPANLASLVSTVSLSNLIIAKTGPRIASRPMLAAALARRQSDNVAPERFVVPTQEATKIEPSLSNVVKDPGFESGAFGHGWRQCETPHASPLASITKKLAHSGKYSGLAGSLTTKSREQYGFAGVCQLVKIPSGGILSAYLYQLTSVKYAKLDGEDAFLIDTHGDLVKILASTANTHAGWERESWNLSSYAGRDLYLYFGVHGDGSPYHHTQQYVDDVSLSGSGPDSDADSDSDGASDGNADGTPVGLSDSASDGIAIGDSDSDTYADGEAHGNSDGKAHGNSNVEADDGSDRRTNDGSNRRTDDGSNRRTDDSSDRRADVGAFKLHK